MHSLGKMLTGALMFSVLVAASLVVIQHYGLPRVEPLSPTMTALAASVRIEGRINGRVSGVGSGTVVSPNIILTADHVCDAVTAKTFPIDLFVIQASGTEVVGSVLRRSFWSVSGVDLCLIEANLAGVEPIRLAADPVPFGTPTFHVGNPWAEPYQVSWGTTGLITKTYFKGSTLRYWAGVAGPGSSGGGVFTADGKLVGVLVMGRFVSGRAPTGIFALVPLSEILAFLDRPWLKR